MTCPNAPDCRKHWFTREDRDDGAECALCGNWLDRTTLWRLLLEAHRASR